jgi:phage gp45-like
MHRATPLHVAARAFTSGGARSVVDKINDGTLMQEMAGNFMKGETRDKIESPQNYGFTSVVMGATKGKDGKISESAEAFISFIGGNRSFPVAGIMDDRRFRLKDLKEGDVAFYDHLQQQFHFNKDGAFLTGRTDKKLRMQLIDPEQQSSGSSSSKDVAELAASGSDGQQQSQSKNKGQTARYQKESKKFVDITSDNVEVSHDKKIGMKSEKTISMTAQESISYSSAMHTFEGEMTGDNASFNSLRVAGRVTLSADTLTIHGDFTVTGDLIVTGVIRAKDFVRLD